MRRFFLVFFTIALAYYMVSCSQSPRKSDVKSKIIGKYCNENHTLILTDTTYTNIKKLKGLTSGTFYEESCTGKYIIDMKEGHWVLRFEKDSHPRAILSCQQEYTLWTEKEGYLIGESSVTLRDPFDNTPVTKEGCK